MQITPEKVQALLDAVDRINSGDDFPSLVAYQKEDGMGFYAEFSHPEEQGLCEASPDIARAYIALAAELLKERTYRLSETSRADTLQHIAQEYNVLASEHEGCAAHIKAFSEENKLLKMRLDLEEAAVAELQADFKKLLAECPPGATVREGKTYRDFQCELADKDKEIGRLREELKQ